MRVVRAEEGRVTVRAICGAEPCNDPDGFVGALLPDRCWACDSNGYGLTAAPGDPLAYELPFGRVQRDDLAEYVVGSSDEIVIEACFEPYASR